MCVFLNADFVVVRHMAGIVLVFACLGVAGWNEYRNVAQMQTLAAGRDSFSQASCAIDSKLDKKLVHVSCDLKNVSRLGREIDGLRAKSAADMTGLTLRSTVEVYAWIESVSKFHQVHPHSLSRSRPVEPLGVFLDSESRPPPGEKKSTNSVGGGDTVVSILSRMPHHACRHRPIHRSGKGPNVERPGGMMLTNEWH